MISSKSIKVIAICAAALGLGSSATFAQVSQQGGPVQWSADQVHSDQNTNTFYLDGRVEIIQDQARLRADHAKMVQATQGGEVTNIEANGNIYYITKDAQGQDTIVRGDNAVYTKSDDTLIMTGDVVMQQGQNVMTGARLTSQVSKGISTLDPASGQAGKGRVKGVIYPSKDQAKAQASAPAGH
jgi:lipopolysaccharide export system protein LptA